MTLLEYIEQIEKCARGECAHGWDNHEIANTTTLKLTAIIKELVGAVEQWNRSCKPHPIEHPSMYGAMENATQALERAQKILEGEYDDTEDMEYAYNGGLDIE